MKTPDDLDKRPPRGKDLISAPYANIYACAKKKTGKSSVVAKMVLKFAGKETKVHIFCSTVFIDPTYVALMDELEDKGIACYPSTSIKDDDGFDLVQDILKEDENFGQINDDSDDEHKDNGLLNLDEELTKKKRKKKSKFKELRRLIIFDDLANEIRGSTSLKTLLKKNRHILCKTIIASQHINDLDPQSINQLDYVFLFKSHNDDKLVELHKKLDLSISPERFISMYKTITGDKTKYDFLYITRFEEYRKNFNNEILLE
jgi:hypothetical protein